MIQLRDATGKLTEAIEAWRATADGLTSFAQIDYSSDLATANQERIASDVVTAFEEEIGSVTMLPQWADYVRVRRWFLDRQHDELLSFLTQHGLPVQTLAALARAGSVSNAEHRRGDEQTEDRRLLAAASLDDLSGLFLCEVDAERARGEGRRRHWGGEPERRARAAC